MCCLAAMLLLLGPRFLIFTWWLVDPARWSLTFDTFILPFLGFIFLPWTVLAYVAVFPGGVEGADWALVVLGLLLDVFSYAGGGYTNRDRFMGYNSTR
jgi:hypothetical protein